MQLYLPILPPLPWHTNLPVLNCKTQAGISWRKLRRISIQWFDKTGHTGSLCKLPRQVPTSQVWWSYDLPKTTLIHQINIWNLTRICCYRSLTELFLPLLGYVELLGHDPHKPLTLLYIWKWACCLFHPSSYPKENPSSMGKSRSSCSCTFGFKFGSAVYVIWCSGKFEKWQA